MKGGYVAAIIVVVLLAGALLAYAYSQRAAGASLTSTVIASSLDVRPLNTSRTVAAGSTVLFLFNVSSPKVGPLYFYASSIPDPGSQRNFSIQNITSNDIELPPGVQVSYPTGQAVFGRSSAVLTLQVTVSPSLTGTVGLVVGAFQEIGQDQTIGSGMGFYMDVRSS